MPRRLTDREMQLMSCKPQTFDEVVPIVLDIPRLDRLRRELETIVFDGSMGALLRRVKAARSDAPDTIEFLAKGAGALWLVNTEGYDYPKYLARVCVDAPA